MALSPRTGRAGFRNTGRECKRRVVAPGVPDRPRTVRSSWNLADVQPDGGPGAVYGLVLPGPGGVLFLFFCLAVLLNPLLGLLKRRYALGRGELLAIYAMLLLLMPAWAMTKALLGFMTGVTYYASPEMRHLEAVLPYSLPWLAVLDAEPVRWLYEGLPKGGSVPWWAWVVPLWSWGSFLVALFVVLGCVAVILRKQWEEHERFAFPIMQVPLAMGERGDGWIGPLFRGRMMWSGFAIPFAIGSMNALHSYYHTLPRISLRAVIWIFRRAIPMSIRLNFALLGYAYFVNLDVSLSIWLLNVIAKCINGVSAMLGAERYGVSGMVGRHSSQGSEFLAFMGMGYMLALAGYSLWIARGHLKAVWTKVLGRPSPLVDSEEVLPYRTAVACVLMGTLYLGCWLYQAGLPPHVIALLFIASFVVFLVLARIVSETGYAATYSPLNPSEFVVCAVGSSAFGPTGLVTTGVGYVWSMTRLNTLMPRASAALRLAREMGRTRGLIWAMGAALAVGLVVASHTTLDLGYALRGPKPRLLVPRRERRRVAVRRIRGTPAAGSQPGFLQGIRIYRTGTGSCRSVHGPANASVMVAHPPDRPACKHDMDDRTLLFQYLSGMGHQGARDEVRRGDPVPEDQAVLYRDHPGRGGLSGHVEPHRLCHRKGRQYVPSLVIHISNDDRPITSSKRRHTHAFSGTD